MFSNTYLAINAWREILARVFDGFDLQPNVSPAWLVNPATRRRLKLDCYYPDAGFAVRFVGITAKGQRRQSDWDVEEEQQRDQTRAELCRLNDVQLLLIDPAEEPEKLLDGMLRLLSRASRTLAQSDKDERYKARWMPQLSAARERLSQMRSRITKNPEQTLTALAESWRDREAGLATGEPAHAPQTANGTDAGRPFSIAQTKGRPARHPRPLRRRGGLQPCR